MPFGLGKKEEIPFKTDITDKDELDEIKKDCRTVGCR
jgi:hypothetical protein